MVSMPAESGGPVLFVRTRGPLTPRRLLLSSPPLLDWVLLGVRDFRAPLPQGPLLIQRGQPLPEAGEGALVLDTRPALQGLLGPHTRLSVTELEGRGYQRGEGRFEGAEKPSECVGGQAHDDEEADTVYMWGQLGCVPSGGPYLCSTLLSPVVSSFARDVGPVLLRVAPVDAESLVRTGRLQEVGGPVDRGSSVWVSKSQLRELGLYHREWVWVSLPGPLDTLGTTREASPAGQSEHLGSQGDRRHLAMILAAELWLGHPQKYSHLLSMPSNTSCGSLTGDGAVISATLLFNLTFGAGAVGEILVERFSNEASAGSSSSLAMPPFAKELYVEIVRSPLYNIDGKYDEALHQHFQTPRVVQVGDILCISTLSHAEFSPNHPKIGVRCPDLYFKVHRIEGAAGAEPRMGFIADSIHTSLYQEGSAHSFVPSFPSRDGHVFWSSVSPAGLSQAVDEMCRVLQPHLQDAGDVLPARGRVLFCGPSGSGKVTVMKAVCSRLNLHLYQVECAGLRKESSSGSVSRLHAMFSRAADLRPCVLLLSHVEMLGKERDGSSEDSRTVSAFRSLLLEDKEPHGFLPLLIVATSSCPGDIPADVRSCFVHEVFLDSPSEDQRGSMLTALTTPLPLSRDVSISQLARRTAGFVLGDLCALLSNASRIACARIGHSCALTEEDEEGLLAAGFPVTSQDFEEALAQLQDSHSQAVGAPKVPCVRWQDVGGLHDVKRHLLDTVQLPLEHPELLSLGLRRSGVLLYGPPGSGKTLLAKAVATECAMTFLSVKGPELINMYVGQSEENVREVFTRARAAAPCIVFFDELDSLAPNRGKSGDSGGVMDRVVSQLLAELDGLHSSNDVFVIGATNRPDLLDSALLRPGRFDKLLYVGVNEDRESQLRVLSAITRKFSLEPAMDLSQVIARCPAALSGADLYALCADAMMRAVKEKIEHLERGQEVPAEDLVIGMEHFVQAAECLRPSVSARELQRYESIRRQFSAPPHPVRHGD
ncbi:peroxisome biogenesis factor 6 [Spea bombifrons]|uniref:peroxisome biogenesis factor 6 n=1 Tax=Spea bombifrons TaxID=233779 RepID=UPI00234BEC47|nr:peroxisome biogenesis factor 6 [Spea bombifrons]